MIHLVKTDREAFDGSPVYEDTEDLSKRYKDVCLGRSDVPHICGIYGDTDNGEAAYPVSNFILNGLHYAYDYSRGKHFQVTARPYTTKRPIDLMPIARNVLATRTPIIRDIEGMRDFCLTHIEDLHKRLVFDRCSNPENATDAQILEVWQFRERFLEAFGEPGEGFKE